MFLKKKRNKLFRSACAVVDVSIRAWQSINFGLLANGAHLLLQTFPYLFILFFFKRHFFFWLFIKLQDQYYYYSFGFRKQQLCGEFYTKFTRQFVLRIYILKHGVVSPTFFVYYFYFSSNKMMDLAGRENDCGLLSTRSFTSYMVNYLASSSERINQSKKNGFFFYSTEILKNRNYLYFDFELRVV